MLFNWLIELLSLRLGDVIFFLLRCALFCVFLENDKMDLCQIFFTFRRKHLFIATCIEKHYTHGL